MNENEHSSQCSSENWGQIDSTPFQVGWGEPGHIQKMGHRNDSAVSVAAPEAMRN